MVTISMLTVKNLEQINGISHGFFGRAGGVSQGIYSFLNCRADENDSEKNVAENKRRVLESLNVPVATFQLLRQMHGCEVAIIDDIISPMPQADGLVTKLKNIALGILTADCAPILFADKNAGIIGCCHAGWRGALAGIAEKTLQAMESLGAERKNVITAIGPCIGPDSYEVSAEFHENFLNEAAENKIFFTPGKPGHFYFNLPGYILAALKKAGVMHTEWVGKDTLLEQRDYFSFRRNTLAGIKTYGCQVSAIVRV